MKFAAKRTWPVRPDTWEYQGEAPDASVFAERFASDRQLAQGTEMVVIEKEGEDSTITFHKVMAVSPYKVETTSTPGGAARPAPAAAPGPESAAVAPEAATPQNTAAPTPPPAEAPRTAADTASDDTMPTTFVTPAMKTGMYMIKVLAIGMAIVFIAAFFMY